MKKSISLNSQEWCDIIFNNKNKSYGAYKLRQSSSKRHIVAFGVTILFAIIIAAIPLIVNAIENYKARNSISENIDMDRIMVNLNTEAEVPEENIIREQMAPPPPPLRSTVRFVPPIIDDDDRVPDDTETPTQDELLSSREQISIANIVGDDDEHGIDIADIEEQQIIIEEEPQIFITVEQMPQFPGGDSEMMRFISENLKYLIVAIESGIKGRVSIRFVVRADGNIDEVEVLRGIDPACDREAIRVVKSMPRWTPGRQNGENVAVYFNLPIVFQLK